MHIQMLHLYMFNVIKMIDITIYIKKFEYLKMSITSLLFSVKYNIIN